MARVRQGELKFANGWGGARKGAGRKAGVLRRDPHQRRPEWKKGKPGHVTVRFREKRTRTVDVHRAVRQALAGLKVQRQDFRVIDYGLEEGHLHATVEADSAEAFDSGMRSLAIRLAKRINAALRRHGRLFDDRHHRRQLSTPLETRNCVAYVLLNHRKHAAERNWNVSTAGEMDPFSSGEWFDGWKSPPPASQEASVVHAPRTWLRSVGWRRRGLIARSETPGPRARSTSWKPTKMALADLYRNL